MDAAVRQSGRCVSRLQPFWATERIGDSATNTAAAPAEADSPVKAEAAKAEPPSDAAASEPSSGAAAEPSGAAAAVSEVSSQRSSRRSEILDAQMAWITLEVDTKTDEDDPTTLLGVPAAFEGSSCFAGVPPHERAWWRFWVPQDWVPPLRVEVRLPSGLLVIALPPAGSAASYLRFSAPKSELVSQKGGPAKQDLPRSPALDLAYCAYCQRTECQCPVKSQLGRRLSFSRRSSVRRVWLEDRGEPPTSLSHPRPAH